MTDIIEPVEDIDFFRIKRIRYELHVEGTVFITADEDWSGGYDRIAESGSDDTR